MAVLFHIPICADTLRYRHADCEISRGRAGPGPVRALGPGLPVRAPERKQPERPPGRGWQPLLLPCEEGPCGSFP